MVTAREERWTDRRKMIEQRKKRNTSSLARSAKAHFSSASWSARLRSRLIFSRRACSSDVAVVTVAAA